MKGESRIYLGLLLVALAMLGTSIYHSFDLNQRQETGFSEQEAMQMAKKFVKNSLTYQFDGYDLKHQETLYPDLVDCERCYTFVFSFKSRHAGYGNRSGQMLAQVITPHEAHVTVHEGEIITALLDNKWDMINQRQID